MIPVTAFQLPFHLGIPGVRVQLVEQDGGFSMKIYHSGITHILHAQRGHVRLFVSLTRAAAFLNHQNIHIFSVATSGATSVAINCDLVRDVAVASASTSPAIEKNVPHQIKDMSVIHKTTPPVLDDLEDHFFQELEDYKDSL